MKIDEVEVGSPVTKEALWKKPKVWGSVVAGAVVFALIFLAFKAMTRETSFVVSCEPIKGGYECKITPSGARLVDARVCWEIHDVCANGTKSMVSKCVRATMEPGQDVRALIADAEFSNHDTCDEITARAFESAFIEAVRYSPLPAQR